MGDKHPKLGTPVTQMVHLHEFMTYKIERCQLNIKSFYKRGFGSPKTHIWILICQRSNFGRFQMVNHQEYLFGFLNHYINWYPVLTCKNQQSRDALTNDG